MSCFSFRQHGYVVFLLILVAVLLYLSVIGEYSANQNNSGDSDLDVTGHGAMMRSFRAKGLFDT